MIVLLDTDVLLDVAVDRDPHVTAAAELLDALERRPGSAFFAWHTVANFCYLVAPRRGRIDARNFILDLTAFIGVAPVTTESLRYAGRLPMSDFEDAMQVAAAVACRADAIATRNLRDYRQSPVRAATPRTLMAEFR